ncbi:MAG: class I SAM-dependent methyltransferase [Flavobacterium sp.]|nr:MAG: class I SAM-dependent methyltransferase [Flavobacterium sp.]
MIHQLKAYFHFLLRSTNAHGLHSPFVFDLATKCFYDKKKYPEYSLLKQFRRRLLDNHNIIKVTDFGAGSRVFRSDGRKISAIAKTAGISEKRAELLFRICRNFSPHEILELGTSVGLATSALALGNPNGKIFTMEGCPETAATAEKQFALSGLLNINTIVGSFEEGFRKVDGRKFGLVYFDGNHRKEATLDYFERLLPTITDSTVWIFDDIHLSAEMEAAWQHIVRNPKVTVTIDTFQWGLVFFHKGQMKEDFVVRA